MMSQRTKGDDFHIRGDELEVLLHPFVSYKEPAGMTSVQQKGDFFGWSRIVDGHAGCPEKSDCLINGSMFSTVDA